MAAQNDICSAGATRINVGLSAVIRVTPAPYEQFAQLKILSGGGTLEIAPIPVALTGSSAAGWGAGYPVGASEIVQLNGPAVFYLVATGATMVATMVLGYTSGATLIA